jgi:hypothetical protein
MINMEFMFAKRIGISFFIVGLMIVFAFGTALAEPLADDSE